MKAHARPLKSFQPPGFALLPEISEEIDHRDRAQQARAAEREAAESAKLLFELVRRTGVKGIVSAIVRPWCDFVDEEPAAISHEQLDSEHAHVVQRLHDRSSEVASFTG